MVVECGLECQAHRIADHVVADLGQLRQRYGTFGIEDGLVEDRMLHDILQEVDRVAPARTRYREGPATTITGDARPDRSTEQF